MLHTNPLIAFKRTCRLYGGGADRLSASSILVSFSGLGIHDGTYLVTPDANGEFNQDLGNGFAMKSVGGLVALYVASERCAP